MGVEIIALIVAVLTLIPVILNARKNRKANRDALGKAEADELGAGMDRVDRLFPPPRQD